MESAGYRRLTKELVALKKRKSLENFIALPEGENMFEWHYVIFGLTDCPYEGGFYHGKIYFPVEYPHKPPMIKMFTPSGRFHLNQPICFSFSNFHPEAWSPAWDCGKIMLGIISFM